jgi:hypothetical protein
MDINLFSAAAGGVATSILLPVMIRTLRAEFSAASPAGKNSSWIKRVVVAAWPVIRKYLILLIFSLVTALLIVAVLGDSITGWRAAFVAGYAWDSTIQKITQRP